jgi:hypothetical protein
MHHIFPKYSKGELIADGCIQVISANASIIAVFELAAIFA